MEQIDDELYFKVHEALRSYQRQRRFAVQSLNSREQTTSDSTSLPVRDIISLLLIEAHDNLTVKDLSQKLGIEHSWTSRLAIGLEKEGLIKSETPENDRRSKVLKLTSSGKRRLAKSLSIEGQIVTDSLTGLKEKDKDFLLKQISLMAHNLGVPPFPSHQEAHPFFMELARLTRAFKLHSDDYLGTGCSLIELQILGLIEKSGESGSTVKELDKYFPLDVSTISRNVSSLEQNGYIYKQQSTEDKRAFRLNLEKKGRATLSKFHEEVIAKFKTALVNTPGSKITELINLLEKISIAPEHRSYESNKARLEIKQVAELTSKDEELLTSNSSLTSGKSDEKRLGLFVDGELKALAVVHKSAGSKAPTVSLSAKEITLEQYGFLINSLGS